MRRSVVITVAVLAALGVAALAATHSPARTNTRLARAFAARGLRAVLVPPGATVVSSDPSAGRVLGSSAPATGSRIHQVDRARFWRVPGDPQAVLAWFRHHRPPGTKFSGSGATGNSSGLYEWSLTFDYRHLPAYLWDGTLQAAAAADSSGGTALRVDSSATPQAPRPGWEQVPAAVHAVTLTAQGLEGGHRYPITTITAPARVRRLVRLFDAARITEPGIAFSCPAFSAAYPFVHVAFSASAGSPARATAADSGCGGVSFSVGRRHGPALWLPELDQLLWRQHALPSCAPAAVRLTTDRVHRSGRPAVYDLAITVKDPGDTACALEGPPRLRLRSPTGAPIPAHVSPPNPPPTPEVQLIDRSWPTSTLISWHRAPASCHPQRVGAFLLALPRSSRWVRIHAPRSPAVAPCAGKLTVTAFGS